MGVPLSSPTEPASGVGPVLASGAVPLAASGAVPPSTPGATGMPPLLLPVTGPPVPPEPDPPAGAPDSEAPSLDREPSRVDASPEHPAGDPDQNHDCNMGSSTGGDRYIHPAPATPPHFLHATTCM